MTVKQFFKSAAFKSLAVLLSIVIIAGALLAIFNDLLSVSDEEKFNRSLQKIYGGDAEVKSTILAADAESVKLNGNTVNQAYLMDDGNYLIQTTGNGGWQNGSITVWVIMSCTGSKDANNLKWNGIERVVYESNDKQSYITRFTDADYALFADHNSDLVAGKLFGDGINVVKTGASSPFTFDALTGAVNTAVNYFKETILGVSTEPDLYKYQSSVNLDESEITPNAAEKKVEYKLVMKKNGPAPSFTVNVTVVEGKITAYSIEGAIADPNSFAGSVTAGMKDGTFFIDKTAEDIEALLTEDGKVTNKILTDNALTTGATYSTASLIYAAAFATANYETCLYPIEYSDWVSEVTTSVDGTSVAYTISVVKNGPAPSFTVNVTVAEGKITAYAIEGAIASPDSFADSVTAGMKDGTYFIDKTLTDLEALLSKDGRVTNEILTGNSLSTGATYSTESLVRAAIYALANYNTYLAKGGEQA